MCNNCHERFVSKIVQRASKKRYVHNKIVNLFSHQSYHYYARVKFIYLHTHKYKQFKGLAKAILSVIIEFVYSGRFQLKKSIKKRSNNTRSITFIHVIWVFSPARRIYFSYTYGSSTSTIIMPLASLVWISISLSLSLLWQKNLRLTFASAYLLFYWFLKRLYNKNVLMLYFRTSNSECNCIIHDTFYTSMFKRLRQHLKISGWVYQETKTKKKYQFHFIYLF